MPTRNVHITGIVLAGGQSRRMFASPAGSGAGSDAIASRSGTGADALHDKGLLPLADKPMLAHVLERLAPQVARIAINANGDPARFASFELPVVADTIDGFVGPLAGVLAGMRWAAANSPQARWIASVSADAPFIPADLVARLALAVAAKGDAIAIAQSAGELHPVIGLWPVALADDLEVALRSGLRKVLAWTDRHGTVPVAFPPQQIGGQAVDPFFNANTPEELAQARRLLGDKTSLAPGHA